MGDLKPLGSEKLQGDEKLKRILELTYYQSSDSLKKTKKNDVMIEQTSTGVYGVVKEKDGYYVKKGLNENSLDYIGGLFMKNKNRFESYNEAYKKLEFLVEQEKLQEATKYVLKSKTPKAESPIPQPTNELPPPEAEPMTPSEPEIPTGEEPEISPDELAGDESSPEEEDYLKIIQKLSGKLQQKLMSYRDKLESKDIKAAIMQVLSGIDIEQQLDDEDIEEILEKFEPETSDETSDETLPTDDVPSPEEDELGEENEDGLKSLEELIGTSFYDDYDDTSFNNDDDDDDDFQLPPEDSRAKRFAQKDYESEFSNDDEDVEDNESLEDDELNNDSEVFDNMWRGIHSSRKQNDEQSGRPVDDDIPLPDEEIDAKVKVPYPEDDSIIDDKEGLGDEEVDDIREIDINELTDAVNTGVKETLSKYFNQ